LLSLCPPYVFFFSCILRPPPRSTLFPTRRSSDLSHHAGRAARNRAERILAAERRADQKQRTVETGEHADALREPFRGRRIRRQRDRKSTRLNSSHVKISYAVFCLKKKKKKRN